MPREIKFRAWIKKKKQMIYLANDYLSDYYMEITNCGWGVFTKGAHTSTACKYNDDILMQYTGLKDKQGKEIFEGDIVECRAGEKYHGTWEHNITVKIEMGFTQSIWEMLNCEEIEVIGNIYDNPELLKEEK